MAQNTDYSDASQYTGYQASDETTVLQEDSIPRFGEQNPRLPYNGNESLSSLPADVEIVSQQSDGTQQAENTTTEGDWEVSRSGEQPTKLVRDDVTVDLPEGASNLEFKDGLPSYTKDGVTVDLNADGKPKAYHSNGFSFEHHDSDDAWYYRQDNGGDYVKIDIPTLNEDGSVTTKENGGLNSGREHSLSATGQSSEGLLSSKLGRIGDRLEVDKLSDAIESGSFSEVMNWGKENIGATSGLGIPSLLLDGITGINTFDTTNAFVKGVGDTLVDGTVNGVVYLAGLTQGGAEKLGMLPNMEQIDQIIPKLDLYEDFDPENASTSETIAARVGQIGGYLVPFAGTAGAVIKGTKGAIAAVNEGRVIASLSDNAANLGGNIKSWFTGSASHGDEAASTAPKSAQAERQNPDGTFGPQRELPAGQADDAAEASSGSPTPNTSSPFDELAPLDVEEVPLPTSGMTVRETDGFVNLAKNSDVESLLTVPAREVQIGDNFFQLTKRNLFQQWMYGGMGRGGNAPVKLHVTTDGPEDLAQIQEVLIPALRRDPELSKLVGDWKTFDPLHGTRNPNARGQLPNGVDQGAKAFTIYPENVDDIAKIESRIDEILYNNGLGRDVPIPTGNVDEIAGLSKRVGVVRDFYEPATIDGVVSGARLPNGLASKIQERFGTPGIEDLRSIETSLGLHPGILHYDDAGRLSLSEIANGSQLQDDMFYLAEGGANTLKGLTDRPAMYALAREFGISLA